MTMELIISWGISIILLAIAVFFFNGKGLFLLAGYNTMGKIEKEKYDKVKLGRVAGTGIFIVSIIMMICSYYEFELPRYLSWLMPYGFLATILILIILVNTICKKK